MDAGANPFSPIPYQSFEVDDFSGGQTDNYVSGAINKFRVGDNLLLEKYGDKAKLILRFGSEIFDSANPILDNANTQRISSLKYFGGAILGFTRNTLMYQAGTANTWTELVGPNGSHSVFSTASDGDDIVSLATWQDHMLVANANYEYISKVYKNSASLYQIRTAGLPDLASSPVVTTSSAGAASYLYRFCYKYSYLVGTVQYVDRGALTEVALASSSSASTANPVAITAIPVLSNTANLTLWDTTNIDVEIYRTTDGGVNFFLAKTIDNGTTSTSDTMTDSTLQVQEILYTEGDVVENDPVPKAALVHVADDTSTAYYARIKDGTEIRTNRLRQSISGDVDSCPVDFFLDVGDEIVGLSSYLSRPILCCASSVYVVNGTFDLLGRGGMTAQKISDRADCVSAQSVVQTLYGVFWCGSDYFYFSDGYQVIPIDIEGTTSHKLFTATAGQKNKIQGKYDRKNNRIWWTIQEDASSSDNDKCVVFHLNFGITQNMARTTVSGGNEFRPTAIEFVEDTMYRGDEDSYLLIHRETLNTDPKIDTAVAATAWAEKTIIYTYESCALDMGRTDVRKVAPRISVSLLNQSSLSMDIISINDDGRITETLRPIRSRTSIAWGDTDVVWGDPEVVWNYTGTIEEWRRFPRASWRFSQKQIKFSNAFVAVTNSSFNGEATTNTTTKVVALAAGSTFPSKSIDYAIAFETDNYSRVFTVTAINTANDQITVSDISNLLPSSGSGTLKWVLRGYPKGEDFRLLSYTIDWAPLGKTQNQYRKGNTGEL